MPEQAIPAAHTGRPLPPSPGRITVYEVEGGAPLSCYPVDAKELLASGAYSAQAPGPPVEVATHASPAADAATGDVAGLAHVVDEGRRGRRK